MKNFKKILTILTVGVLSLLIAIALIACGGDTTTKKAPILTSIKVVRSNTSNTDTTNIMCLAVVNGKCEKVAIELLFTNPDELAITSFKVNGAVVVSNDFRVGSTPKRVVIDYAPTETTGALDIVISDINYKVGSVTTKISNLANNTTAVKIAPEFEVTFDFSASSATGADKIQKETAVFGAVYDNLNKFYASDKMDEMNTDKGSNYGKSGYVFVGWFTEANGAGRMLEAEEKYDFYSDITLYAHYELIFKSKKIINEATGEEYMAIVGINSVAKILSSLILPNTIDGLPVKELSDNALTSSLASTITLNENLVRIGKSACQSISANVVFNACKNLEEIGDSAFNGCTGLGTGVNNINFPASLKIIGANAFQGTGWNTVYEGTKFDKTLIIPNTIQKIGDECFKGSTFKAVYFMEGSTLDAQTFGANMFQNSTSIETVFTSANFDSLTKQMLAAADGGLKYIGKYAFSGCTSLKTMAGTDGKNASGLNLAEGLVTIDDFAFNKLADDKKVSNLLSVTLPNSLVTMGNNAFANSGLKKIIFKGEQSSDSKLATIGDYAFSECNFVEVHLYTKELYNYKASPFWGNTNLRSVFLYATAVPYFKAYNNISDGGAVSQSVDGYIKYYVSGDVDYLAAFKNEWKLNEGNYLTGYKEVSVSAYLISGIKVVEGVRYATEDYSDTINGISGTRLVGVFPTYYAANDTYKENEIVTIPASIENKVINSIGKRFAYKSLKGVTFKTAGNIVEIHDEAFYDCKNFTTDLSKLTGLEIIGSRAFYGTKITSFESNSKLRVIGEQAFYLCRSLTTAKIRVGNNVWIKDGAFDDSGLITVQLGAAVAYLESAFCNCPALARVYIQHESPIPYKVMSTFKIGPFRSSGAGATDTESGDALKIYLSSNVIINAFKANEYTNGDKNYFAAYAKNYVIGSFPAN